MKLFGWMQNKLKSKQESGTTTIYAPDKNQTLELGAKNDHESNDQVHGFLSIGTLWTKEYSKEDCNEVVNEKDLILEEFKEIQKEVNEFTGNKDEEEEEMDEKLSSMMPKYKGKDGYLESSRIRKKSLSFLLKKMFVCGSPGFGPAAPTLKDPILISPPMTTMEKILRAILEKKIHPQSPCQSLPKKKYLKNTHTVNSEDDHEGNVGCKWVKTDTEYIVLEI